MYKRRLHFFMIMLMLNVSSHAQTFWYKYSPTYFFYNSSVVTPDLGLIIAANATDTTAYMVARIMRIDSVGNMIWSKQMDLTPDTGREMFADIIATSDSCYLAAGTFYQGGGNTGGICIHKFDPDGNTKWVHVLSPDSCSNYITGGYSTFSVIEAADKGFVISGSLATFNASGIFMLKTDSTGNPEWFRAYNNSSDDLRYLYKNLCRDQDSGFVMFTQFYDLNQDAMLVHVDKSGNLIWSAALDSTNAMMLNAIYNFNGEVYLSFDKAFAKTNLDTADIHLTLHTPAAFPSIDFRTISKCFNGDFAVVYVTSNGTTHVTGNLRTDSLGNFKSAHVYDALQFPDQITELPDGRFLYGGTGTSNSTFYTDVILFDTAMSIPCYEDTISFLTDTLTERLHFAPVTETICYMASYDPAISWHDVGTVIDYCAYAKIPSIEKSGINIFPNPTKGDLHLSGNEMNAEISLYSISGSKLFARRSTAQIQDLDLTPYPKGVYVLQVSGQVTVTRVKIILQ